MGKESQEKGHPHRHGEFYGGAELAEAFYACLWGNCKGLRWSAPKLENVLGRQFLCIPCRRCILGEVLASRSASLASRRRTEQQPLRAKERKEKNKDVTLERILVAGDGQDSEGLHGRYIQGTSRATLTGMFEDGLGGDALAVS
jgi:hypothetical protein